MKTILFFILFFQMAAAIRYNINESGNINITVHSGASGGFDFGFFIPMILFDQEF